MQQRLSPRQATLLGLVVLVAIGLSGGAVWRVGSRQGLFAETFDASVGFAQSHEVSPGTAVRIRGVNAGQVVAVDYPDADGPDAVVTLRLKLDARFADRLYADATARLHATGLLSAKVVAIDPGTPAAGPLVGGKLRAAESPDLAAAAAKFGAAADEAEKLLREARTGNGSFARLIRDDDFYRELKALAADSRKQVNNLSRLTEDGRDTMRSVRQGSDALSKMPIVRSYVEETIPLLVRPTCRREAFTYNTADIFEPDSAILTDAGRTHLGAIAGALSELPNEASEVVVACYCDPESKTQTSASATELTRKQAEVALAYLKTHNVHKLGVIARRTMTALGMGTNPPPVREATPTPPSYLQVLVFTPQ
jgi:phospholipid/cholesterol/gamma-HCH transport system substrate-binding protein